MSASVSPPPASGESQDLSAIPEQAQALRRSFQTGRTRSLEWRLQQLANLRRLVSEQEEALIQAVHDDLGRPRMEAYIAEVQYLLGEIDHIRKHLRKWMKPDKVMAPMVAQPATGRIQHEPLGVVLIIAPWNYPAQLLLGPLAGAIAGGNCAMLKPSEVSSATSAFLAREVPRYMDSDCITLVEGAVPETTALLEQRWDHIFYTGNGHVGRIVMAAAAKHLTPVTLELGGKSPVIVDRNVDMDVCMRRLVWGKFFNAGQTCVAPDYVLAHGDVYEQVLTTLQRTVTEFYGADPKQSPHFGRVVNTRHHRRLMGLMEGSEVAVGGEADEATCYIAPTVLRDVSPDAPVMQQEIFGPILPVLKVGNVHEAIDFINARDKPLALYVHSSDKRVQEQVIQQTSSGAVTINHTWAHMGVTEFPFGGVGESGMGAYHGHNSFRTFTHAKPILYKPTVVDPPLIYPPMTPEKEKWLKRLL